MQRTERRRQADNKHITTASQAFIADVRARRGLYRYADTNSGREITLCRLQRAREIALRQHLR